MESTYYGQSFGKWLDENRSEVVEFYLTTRYKIIVDTENWPSSLPEFDQSIDPFKFIDEGVEQLNENNLTHSLEIAPFAYLIYEVEKEKKKRRDNEKL
tara:strand:- start:372 stop:665 length:294 start_codon:yes stop_codon:yes gene_type:complete